MAIFLLASQSEQSIPCRLAISHQRTVELPTLHKAASASRPIANTPVRGTTIALDTCAPKSCPHGARAASQTSQGRPDPHGRTRRYHAAPPSPSTRAARARARSASLRSPRRYQSHHHPQPPLEPAAQERPRRDAHHLRPLVAPAPTRTPPAPPLEREAFELRPLQLPAPLLHAAQTRRGARLLRKAAADQRQGWRSQVGVEDGGGGSAGGGNDDAAACCCRSCFSASQRRVKLSRRSRLRKSHEVRWCADGSWMVREKRKARVVARRARRSAGSETWWVVR